MSEIIKDGISELEIKKFGKTFEDGYHLNEPKLYIESCCDMHYPDTELS